LPVLASRAAEALTLAGCGGPMGWQRAASLL
jgi:hypothetical protein